MCSSRIVPCLRYLVFLQYLQHPLWELLLLFVFPLDCIVESPSLSTAQPSVMIPGDRRVDASEKGSASQISDRVHPTVRAKRAIVHDWSLQPSTVERQRVTEKGLAERADASSCRRRRRCSMPCRRRRLRSPTPCRRRRAPKWCTATT